MSMIVARMQKMKSGNLVGIGNHNQRKTENHTNKEIDPSLSKLNYDLVNRTENYKRDIEKFINENKSTKRAVRKDAVLINEWIITSDKKFFENLSQEETKDFFSSAKDYFAENFGEKNIRYATVHLDESTPHMHMGIVPFDKDNKLSAKRVFNRETLRDIQENLPKYLQEKGFDIKRGIEGSDRKNLTVPEFKEMKKEQKEIERQIDRRKNELVNLTNEKPKKISSKSINAKYEMKTIDKPTGKKLLGVPLTEKKKVKTGNIVLPEEEFLKLRKSAQQNQQLKAQMEKYLTTDLAKENRELRKKNEVVKNKYSDLIESFNSNVKDYNELLEENISLKGRVKDLTNEIGSIYKSVKEFLKERTDDLRAFKRVFNDLVDKVKEKSPKGEFERLERKEKSREKYRGMER